MSINRTILAVDVSNQLYKAAASHPNLSSEERFTGGIYGFISAISLAITATNATDIVLCLDCKPYKRSELYPEYKSLRKTTSDPELIEKVKYSKTLLDTLVKTTGWPVWGIPGFEADDLISQLVVQHRHRFKVIVAMSNDSDLWQLFHWPQFSIYRGKKGFFTREEYQKTVGLSRDQQIMALALSGTHNEISGLEGIGPVKSAALVRNPAELRKVHAAQAAIIDRNISLITLPHPDLPKTAHPPTPGIYSERALMRFCGQYDINIYPQWLEAFSQVSNNGKGISVRSPSRKSPDTTLL